MSIKIDKLPRKVLTDPVNFLAFGFGTGLAPVAPGTFGSLPGVLLAWLTLDSGLYVQLAVLTFLVLVHDHGGIVWDEIAGMYMTLLLAPATVAGFVIGFLLFRLFDIAKPWPIRDLDHRLGGGLGIMLDDLAAALYALLLLALYRWLMS